MAVQLFELLDDVFGNGNIAKYSEQELKSIGFSVNRIMSIKYPSHAQSQNVIGINMANVVKYWAMNMKGKFNGTPPWAMVATAKARKEYQAKVGEMEMPEKEILDAFMNYHNIDKHELKFLVERRPKELEEALGAYEKGYNAK